jgi:quinol monooxygenase YgiN
MYARMILLTTKPGQASEISRAMQEGTLPILRQQAGFVDAIALVSDNEKERFVWKSKEDADRYMASHHYKSYNLSNTCCRASRLSALSMWRRQQVTT